MDSTTISFIGGGNMARALVGGLLASGITSDRITVADPSPDQRRISAEEFSVAVTADSAAAVSDRRVVVIAVKPQVMPSALKSVRAALPASALVISVAAGITLDALSDALSAAQPCVRAMPNTPALYRAGMTGMVANSSVSAEDRSLAEHILGGAGEVVWIDDESQMDAVTAVSGSGPAYFFALTEFLTQAGIEVGLPPATAAKLARQTAVGAGRMLAHSPYDASELRHRVTSPGGTTEAALTSLMDQRFHAIVGEAVRAAVRRGRELGAR
jgi:pyrroline-5-carboxylate reductase